MRSLVDVCLNYNTYAFTNLQLGFYDINFLKKSSQGHVISKRVRSSARDYFITHFVFYEARYVGLLDWLSFSITRGLIEDVDEKLC